LNSYQQKLHGRLHSINDEPALIDQYGSKWWYKDDELHRDNDDPAVVHPNGTMMWYKNGKCHRDNGLPAIISATGGDLWYVNGIYLSGKQIKLLKKINASEIKYLPWLLNEDPALNSVIEKRMNLGI
jgi:hypothetical protein